MSLICGKLQIRLLNFIAIINYNDMHNYIYSLDIPEGQKHILFKAEYPKTKKYNYQIIEYLNSRSDISYRNKEKIVKELGFNIDSEGNVTW